MTTEDRLGIALAEVSWWRERYRAAAQAAYEARGDTEAPRPKVDMHGDPSVELAEARAIRAVTRWRAWARMNRLGGLDFDHPNPAAITELATFIRGEVEDAERVESLRKPRRRQLGEVIANDPSNRQEIANLTSVVVRLALSWWQRTSGEAALEARDLYSEAVAIAKRLHQ